MAIQFLVLLFNPSLKFRLDFAAVAVVSGEMTVSTAAGLVCMIAVTVTVGREFSTTDTTVIVVIMQILSRLSSPLQLPGWEQRNSYTEMVSNVKLKKPKSIKIRSLKRVNKRKGLPPPPLTTTRSARTRTQHWKKIQAKSSALQNDSTCIMNLGIGNKVVWETLWRRRPANLCPPTTRASHV